MLNGKTTKLQAILGYTVRGGYRFFTTGGGYFDAYGLVKGEMTLHEMKQQRIWERLLHAPDTPADRQMYDKIMNDRDWNPDYEDCESETETEPDMNSDSCSESPSDDEASDDECLSDIEELLAENAILNKPPSKTTNKQGKARVAEVVPSAIRKRNKRPTHKKPTPKKPTRKGAHECIDISDDDEVIPEALVPTQQCQSQAALRATTSSGSRGLMVSTTQRTANTNKPLSRPQSRAVTATIPNLCRSSINSLPVNRKRAATQIKTEVSSKVSRQDEGARNTIPSLPTAPSPRPATSASTSPTPSTPLDNTTGAAPPAAPAPLTLTFKSVVEEIVQHDRSAMRDPTVKDFLHKLKAALALANGKQIVDSLYIDLVDHLYSTYP